MAPSFFGSKRNKLHYIVEKGSAQELSEALSDRYNIQLVNEITGGGKSTLSLLVQGQGNICNTADDSLLKLQQLLPYADEQNITIFWDALKNCPDNTEFLKDTLYEFLLNETKKMKNELNTQGDNTEEYDEIMKLYGILLSLKKKLDTSEIGFNGLIDNYVSFIDAKENILKEAERKQEEREEARNRLYAMNDEGYYGGGKRKQRKRKTKRNQKKKKRNTRRY